MSDTRFAGENAIVTGAADGLGRATSIALAKGGAKVLLVDIDKDRLEETEEMIKSAGGTAVTCIANVTKTEDVQGYVRAAIDSFGSIDIFFNNAGICHGFPLTDYPEDAFDQIIAVNLRGVFLGLKYVLKEMLKQGSGAIVSTGSMASTGGIPFLAGYVASKHAVVGLTKTAALEVANTGIRVNAVLPGNIHTKMSVQASGGDSDTEAAISLLAATVPQGRMGMPEEIADAVCFLFSDEAKHITGIAVPVDGGITAQVYPMAATS